MSILLSPFAARVLFIQLRGPTLRALSDGALLKV